MTPKRRRSDIAGRELQPYGPLDVPDTTVTLSKHQATDKTNGRSVEEPTYPAIERRKRSYVKTMNLASARTPVIEPAKKNKTAVRLGYDPYESGEIVKHKNPGVRRDLRELGVWLTSESHSKPTAPNAVTKKSPPER